MQIVFYSGAVFNERVIWFRLIHFTSVSARRRLYGRSVTIFKSTPTNGPVFTAPGLPWWSPVQVLTEVDLP